MLTRTTLRVPFDEIDLANADQFSALLERHRQAPGLVLDMSEVVHFDSSAIRALLLEVRERRASDPIRLVNVTSVVRKVVEICDLGQLLRVEAPVVGPALTTEARQTAAW